MKVNSWLMEIKLWYIGAVDYVRLSVLNRLLKNSIYIGEGATITVGDEFDIDCKNLYINGLIVVGNKSLDMYFDIDVVMKKKEQQEAYYKRVQARGFKAEVDKSDKTDFNKAGYKVKR